MVLLMNEKLAVVHCAGVDVSDNRLLEKSDLQTVLSERYQTDKYEVQRGHESR